MLHERRVFDSYRNCGLLPVNGSKDMDQSGVLLKLPNKSGKGARRRAPLPNQQLTHHATNTFATPDALEKSSSVT
jgi:hypothetical protein